MTRTADDRLDLRIRDRALETAHRYAPWRDDLAWWIVGAQAAALLVLALVLLLIQGSDALVVLALGIVFLFVAAAWAWSAMQSALPQVVLGWRGLRGGVGIATGTLVVLGVLHVAVTADALGILAVGLLLAGVLGCVEWWVGRRAMGWRWPSLGGSAISIAYGIVVLASGPSDRPLFIQTLALVALAIGGVLAARTVQLWRREQGDARPEPDAAEVPTVADAPARPAAAARPTPAPRPRVTTPPPGTTPAPTVAARSARPPAPRVEPPAVRPEPDTDGPAAPRN